MRNLNDQFSRFSMLKFEAKINLQKRRGFNQQNKTLSQLYGCVLSNLHF